MEGVGHTSGPAAPASGAEPPVLPVPLGLKPPFGGGAVAPEPFAVAPVVAPPDEVPDVSELDDPDEVSNPERERALQAHIDEQAAASAEPRSRG
jgi:hypothetical protein